MFSAFLLLFVGGAEAKTEPATYSELFEIFPPSHPLTKSISSDSDIISGEFRIKFVRDDEGITEFASQGRPAGHRDR